MTQKNKLRKKYFRLRKKKYYEIDDKFFLPFTKFIKSNFKKKPFNLALYFPSNFEVNILKILKNDYFSNKNILLPAIEKNNSMNFFSWKKNEVLVLNKYGIPEPIKSKIKIPDIVLVPTLAFDNTKYRLGYGRGFYDRYLNKLKKKNNKIVSVGVAFSFQKYHKLPISKNDEILDFILTEKGLI